jgi:pyruvate dehydrogenase E1 component alpha subunit
VAAEVDIWKERDPITRLRTYLTEHGLVDDAFFAALQAESDELAAHVRQGCLALPDPDPLSMFDHVYVDEHPLLREEREQFAAYRASFLDEPAADGGRH